MEQGDGARKQGKNIGQFKNLKISIQIQIKLNSNF